MTWRVKLRDHVLDEVVMDAASVHLEDLGNAYMLIVENGEQHIHVTIPVHRKHKAFIFEQFTPRKET